jgi:DNA-binding MarR family transcriptional regulator
LRAKAANSAIGGGDQTMKKALQLNRNERAWTSLFRTATVVQRARELELAPLGISAIQAGVLYVLAVAEQPPTPSQLARLLYREPHSMSALLTRMEKQGLVKRSEDPQQSNLVRVTLSKKGELTFERQWGRKLTNNITACLSEEDLRVLETCLQKMHDRAIEIIRGLQPTPYDTSD